MSGSLCHFISSAVGDNFLCRNRFKRPWSIFFRFLVLYLLCRHTLLPLPKSYVLVDVCSFVCLSVCLSVFFLLATSLKNYWSDLHDYFTRDVSLDKEVLVKFWKTSGSGSELRIGPDWPWLSKCSCAILRYVTSHYTLYASNYRRRRRSYCGRLILLLLQISRTRTMIGRRIFAVAGQSLWNSLPAALRRPEMTLRTFKRQLKACLFYIWCATNRRVNIHYCPALLWRFSWFWSLI